MNTNEKPNLAPLPNGIKLRKRTFGANLFSALATVHSDRDAVVSKFTIRWEDAEQGLAALVHEQSDGRLKVDVSSTNAGLLDKGWLAVALVGIMNDHMIQKTIPLNVPEKNGCSGSADLGPLSNAVSELGEQLRVIAFLNYVD